MSGITGLSILVPVAAYLLHAIRFGQWIVDDAGISFAYARSIAGSARSSGPCWPTGP